MADGMFYLGKELTGKGEELGKDYLLDADDLTTHAMVLGMTGSGKTGLCLDLVEEAIEAEIPLIIIDPKGDITNLALMFPEFTAADFQPWVAPEEAESRRGDDVVYFKGQFRTFFWFDQLIDIKGPQFFKGWVL